MGIDIQSIKLLNYVQKKHGGLGKVVTLGRLAIHLGPLATKQLTGDAKTAFSEVLLKTRFGASSVDSIDNSNYEGANIVVDMNYPVPKILETQYDSVLDFGCTEHIFDVAQSFRNIRKMCKVGGLILHAVPANQCCGHGFYQFSPEMFFSLYSDENGFSNTEVFLAEMHDGSGCYKVSAPKDGRRINIRSNGELYVMVVTKRVGEKEPLAQQSDYLHLWNDCESNNVPQVERRHSKFAALREILSQYRFIALWVYLLDSFLSDTGPKSLRRHPALKRIDLDNVH